MFTAAKRREQPERPLLGAPSGVYADNGKAVVTPATAGQTWRAPRPARSARHNRTNTAGFRSYKGGPPRRSQIHRRRGVGGGGGGLLFPLDGSSALGRRESSADGGCGCPTL